MNRAHLAALLERPEIQQRILNDYEGGYSLGITGTDQNRSEMAIRVHIEGERTPNIPSFINLEGERIQIIVNTNFKIPESLVVD